MSVVEMSANAPEESPSPGVESDAPLKNTPRGDGQEKAKCITEIKAEEPGSNVEMKMVGLQAEAGEEQPAVAADKAASEEVKNVAVMVNQEATATSMELQSESRQSFGFGNNEPENSKTIKEAKEEPGEESQCSGMDCDKSKTSNVSEDGEKPCGGVGTLGDKRRSSVEISSSDGEPLSRMDSEDRLVGKLTGSCPELGVNVLLQPMTVVTIVLP